MVFSVRLIAAYDVTRIPSWRHSFA